MKSISEYILESQIDEELVKELLIQAWNVQEITKQIEATIKAMNKKDPSTISQERLATSSVMKKICAACIKAEDPSLKVDTATRKEFCNQLAAEMIEAMPDYK